MIFVLGGTNMVARNTLGRIQAEQSNDPKLQLE